MNRNTFYISAPVDTYSGYGARSRDLIKAIIELDKYDVKILAQRWGTTPWGFCEDHEEWSFLSDYIVPNITNKPDIWAQCTIPSEFQPIGKYNIGFTAGIEATVCAPDWIEGLNRMDVTFVSSEHSKNVFEQVAFEKKDEKTGQSIGKIELLKPVEVLFEGVNIDTYKPLKDFKSNSINLGEMKESFAFLHCGMWLQGDIGEDRKNIGMTIKVFLETFKNKVKQPALLLKVSQGTSSYMGRDAILEKIEKIKATVKSNRLPNIYLLNGDLTDEEMNELYNHPKVKAMVSFTKGEGFGRPLLEFSTVQKPILTTNWSGHIDFLHEEHTSLIGGTLTPIHASAANKWLLKEAQWFTIDYPQAGGHMRDIFEDYKKYQVSAKRQAAISTKEFSYDAMKDLLGERLQQLVPKLAQIVELKLPTLSKLPTLTK
tara:strand:- start:373 stop:1656 length:1284 start_codon:yes stop_codon:yes gene_type:complete